MGDNNLKFQKNNNFKSFCKELKSIYKYNDNNVKKYQFLKIRELIEYASKNIPYYKSLDIDLSSFKKLDDFYKFPFLTKKIIKKNYAKFNNKSINPKDIIYMTTGGSTGNPLKIPMTNEYKCYSLASTFFYLSHFNCNPIKDKSVRLHGDIIKNNNGLYEIHKNKLLLSSNKIINENCKRYHSILSKFKPKYIHAYPSALYLLAKLFHKNQLKFNEPLKYIFTDSEMLYPYQKKIIERVFKTKVISIYGHTEGAVFGMNFKNSDKIHIHPFIGFLELIDKNGNIIKNYNKKGEIVVTGFLNKALPLIRYKTGDYAAYFKVSKSKNLFNYKVLRGIEGRIQDFLINKNDKLIPVGPMLFDYNINWSEIEKFQIIQNQKGKLIFCIKLYSEIKFSYKTFQKKINQLFGDEIEIKVKMVKEIKNTKRGKYRYFVQNIRKIN